MAATNFLEVKTPSAATRLHSLPQSLTVPQTRLTADYSGGTAQIFGEIGYNIPYQSVALEPFANLAYANLHLDGFTETGGSAALASTSSYTDVTSSTVGLRASPPLSFGSAHVTLRGMAGWRHAYGDVRPLLHFAFTGTDTFEISALPIARRRAAGSRARCRPDPGGHLRALVSMADRQRSSGSWL